MVGLVDVWSRIHEMEMMGNGRNDGHRMSAREVLDKLGRRSMY
jgi:hypothetical protein